MHAHAYCQRKQIGVYTKFGTAQVVSSIHMYQLHKVATGLICLVQLVCLDTIIRQYVPQS